MRRVALFVTFIVAQIIFVLALVACGEDQMETRVTNPSQRVDWGRVEEIRLTDGTLCAVFAGSDGRGGIDCDWKEG